MSERRTQFVGFVAAGGIATLANYGLFLAFLRLGLNYLAAASAGYLSGIAISFLINRFLVYRSRQPLTSELARYFLSYILALVAQLAVLQVLVWGRVAPEIANAFAIVLVVIVNFFVVRRFVFRRNRGVSD